MLALEFLDSATLVPPAPQSEEVAAAFNTLASRIRQIDDANLTERMQAILAHKQGHALISAIFAYSPYLSRLLLMHLSFFAECCSRHPDKSFSHLRTSLVSYTPNSVSELMQTLRITKGKASLLIAAADIAGIWPLERITAAMSEIADLCINHAVRFLLAQAAAKGEIVLANDPAEACGLFILAVGKLGAHELNYSSDVDLIAFYNNDAAVYRGSQHIQQCFAKLVQELVRLLQERTKDGYVFRVDLRLRPDPASTPVALSTAGAMTYYETVGQNWERAALIKARVVAGDRESGQQFLKQIAPFIWRKHLDFAAIADIQSIKRQMDARTDGTIAAAGHNIKTGIGGIREIEFFAQIHQLIWGGRVPVLRISGTCLTLSLLMSEGLIKEEIAQGLTDSYRFLRNVEHRLQMIDDQQTHTIPVNTEARAKLAAFLGYSSIADFERILLRHLNYIHDIFSDVFKGQGSLGSDGGKLSFTGVENDPQTLETIGKMGYKNPATISEVIQGWHHGSRRATRTKRARELITELTPTLLKAFADTSQPDQAFMHFDTFLTRLPAGVQLFSLFAANPRLLDLIAVIMSSAPAMAESLSKNPNLLDTVLTTGFYRELPSLKQLQEELAQLLDAARDYQDAMDVIRRFKNEKQFQAGVQLIRNQITATQASHYLSDIADNCIGALLFHVEAEFAHKHPGALSAGSLAVLALGRLGAHELTFGSDIDLVFLYEGKGKDALPQKHILYNKLSQRFIGALTALTREGRLYEVDTRLRPSGKDGALAVSISAFDKYFNESAWTYELMALTRARVITGNPPLKKHLQEVFHNHLTSPHKREKLVTDIATLRDKITHEFGGKDPWNLKYAQGGLMDLDFLAQYFLLLHAHTLPQIVSPSSAAIFKTLAEHGLLKADAAQTLIKAHYFYNALLAMLRLCGNDPFDEHAAPTGLKRLIAVNLGLADFDSVRGTLLSSLAAVQSHFKQEIGR